MNKYIDMSLVKEKINVSNDLNLILLDELDNKNIFLVGVNAKVIWQVHTDFDEHSGPFTNIFIEDDIIKCYRWDGGVYKINLKTGHAIPLNFIK